ncbi:Cytosolic sulfotransferase 8 [Zea mays]|uniref:Sulfotransferase n=1 Tax=Zea mays TaxID=4577 RepID=A0A317YIT8_MAIZE|nr:Cytosolic sulfotransferase 8 [Zea mays]
MAQVPSESSKSDAETSPPADKAPPEISSPECYSDLVSTRPARGGWVQPLVLYQNYWLTPGRLQHIIPVKELYKPRADDIVLATYPKCGTTWLKALAFAITTRSRHAFAAHPLLARHPQELVPHLELPALAGDLADVEKLAALPEASRDSPTPFPAPAGRVRLPRRVPVPASQGRLRLVVGFSPLGPFWEHYLEYWKASLERPQHILFLRYEEIVADPVKVVKTLAGFFSDPFTEAEERGGVPEQVARLCSFEVLSGLEKNQTGGVAFGNDLVIGKSTFFREGKVGDWENHMTKEQGQRLDDVLEDKLKGSGLVF